MYLVEIVDGPRAKVVAKESAPFGASFSEDVVVKTEKVEIWGSDLDEPGADYCEYKAFDASGTLIGTKKVSGY